MKQFFMLSVLLMSCLCFAQKEIPNEKSLANVCWDANSPDNAKYIVYQKEYGVANSQWQIVGITSTKSITVVRPSYSRFEFGVRTIYGSDTSDIHSSLDSTACKDAETCDSCLTIGSWYIYWEFGKPFQIKIVK